MADDNVVVAALPMPPKSKRTFMRQSRETAEGWYFESTAGAKVLIPRAEIYKLIESHEPKFCVPTTK